MLSVYIAIVIIPPSSTSGRQACGQPLVIRETERGVRTEEELGVDDAPAPPVRELDRAVHRAAGGRSAARTFRLADNNTHRMKMHSVLNARPKIMNRSFWSSGMRFPSAVLAARPAIGRRVCHRTRNSVAQAT